ncbi:endo-1,4-beta-xylanase [Cellulomonas endophytica]|uniref:endo-1,4-beta-xylanase n=1 Tax=Cellulomonas endophytica TaxID=2494735 RepID=UPI0010121AC5|nr:endo-1,4-beta-xylanase [Cellulomonas endophytica]
MKHPQTLIAGILALAVTAAGASAAVAAPADPRAVDRSPALASRSLAALAEPIGLEIGVAVAADQLGADRKYTKLVAGQFSTVTPENAMKWESVEPQQGVFDWAAGDALVASAEANGQLVRGHTLVWHSQLPDWLSPDGVSSDFSPEELREILREHVITQVTHYKGDIWHWDVVNEALNEDGTPRVSVWSEAYRALGLDPLGYIADAFRWAHEADPEAKLYYNDYNLEFTGPKSNAAHALAQDLLADGVPIDGMGFQGHLSTQYGFPDLEANLDRFADLGLEVALTEVDVRTAVAPRKNHEGEWTSTPATAEGFAAQREYWVGTLEACLAVPACVSYTVWGLADSNSWIPGVFPGEGAALLWDDHLNAKPQLADLREVLATSDAAPRVR